MIKISDMKIGNWASLLFLVLFSFSCSEVKEIEKEQAIEKEINLTFNESAILSHEFITFEINDDFDFDNLTLFVNNKETTEKTFKVEATQQNVKVKLRFLLKDKAKTGNYNFSVKVKDQSDGFISEERNKSITFKNEKEGFEFTKYSNPKSFTEKLLIYLAIALAILIIIYAIYFILSRDNMPLGKKTFLDGIVTYPDGQLPIARLEVQNRYRYDISHALSIEPGIILDPYDKFYNKKKRRFARLKNTSNAEIIIHYDGIKETIGVTQDLYNNDEVIIKTLDNKLFIINYSNRKNIRI